MVPEAALVVRRIIISSGGSRAVRIGQFCIRYPPAMGGAETHVHEITNRFRKRGHEVSVFTTDLDTEFPFKKLEGTEDPDWVVRRRAYNPFPFHYVVAPGMVKDIGADLDLVHAHSYGYFQTNLSSFVAGLKDIPLVITPHYHPPWTMIGGSGRMAARKVFDRYAAPFLLSRADVIVNVSHAERRQMDGIVPKGVKRVVIPNGIDLTAFSPPPDGKTFRERYGIEGPMLLYTGRLAQNKRLEHVIEALPAILGEVPDLTFVAVGTDNGMRELWTALAKRTGVLDSMKFIDFVPYDVLVDAYGAADVYILPSDYEAFGIVLLEAMAAKCPTVVSRVGGVTDVVVDGKTGYLYEYGNVDMLSEKVLALLADPELRADMGETGRRRVEDMFTWDRVVDMLLDLYGTLV